MPPPCYDGGILSICMLKRQALNFGLPFFQLAQHQKRGLIAQLPVFGPVGSVPGLSYDRSL